MGTDSNAIFLYKFCDGRNCFRSSVLVEVNLPMTPSIVSRQRTFFYGTIGGATEWQLCHGGKGLHIGDLWNNPYCEICDLP